MHNNENNHISTTVQRQKQPNGKRVMSFVTAENRPTEAHYLSSSSLPAHPHMMWSKELSMQIKVQALLSPIFAIRDKTPLNLCRQHVKYTQLGVFGLFITTFFF